MANPNPEREQDSPVKFPHGLSALSFLENKSPKYNQSNTVDIGRIELARNILETDQFIEDEDQKKWGLMSKEEKGNAAVTLAGLMKNYRSESSADLEEIIKRARRDEFLQVFAQSKNDSQFLSMGKDVNYGQYGFASPDELKDFFKLSENDAQTVDGIYNELSSPDDDDIDRKANMAKAKNSFLSYALFNQMYPEGDVRILALKRLGLPQDLRYFKRQSASELPSKGFIDAYDVIRQF